MKEINYYCDKCKTRTDKDDLGTISITTKVTCTLYDYCSSCLHDLMEYTLEFYED